MKKTVASRESIFVRCTAVLLAVFFTVLLTLPGIVDASSRGGGGDGRGHGGGHGGGIGIGIGIRVPLGTGFPGLPEEAIQQAPSFPGIADPDDEEKEAPVRPRGQTQVKASEAAPAGKLAKIRIPYLTELAMDIDEAVMDLVAKEPAKAVKVYQTALQSAKRTKDAQTEKKAYTNMGHVYFLTGNPSKAVDSYQGALAAAKKLGETRDEGVMLRNVAAAFTAWGNFKEAAGRNLDALEIFSGAGDQRGAQMVYNNLGVLQKNQERYKPALAYYEKALAVAADKGRLMGITLKNQARLAAMWGDDTGGLQSLESALEAARAAGDNKEEAEIFLRIADVFQQRGETGKALEAANRAVEVFKLAGAPVDWPYKIMGDLYLDMGMMDQAEQYLKEADYDSSLGRLYLMKEDFARAKKHYEQLLTSSQKQDNPEELFTAYTGLGRLSESTKTYKKADTYYGKGMEIAEEIRLALLPAERKNFFAGRVNGYFRSEPAKGLIRVSFKENKPARSILPSEATKARDFADNLSHRADGRYFGVPKEILEKEMDLANISASLKTAILVVPKAKDPQRFAELSKQIKEAEKERNEFVQKLRKDYPEYASVRYPSPVTIEGAALEPGEYVIMFDVLGEGIGVKLLKGKKIADSAYIELPAEELETDIRLFRKSFESVRLGDFDPDLAARLYKKLLAPVLKQVPPNTPITIIPDGLLALIPFETLVTGGKVQWKEAEWGDVPTGLVYVGDTYSPVYHQSLTTMTMVRTLRKKQTGGNRMLVMADPVFEMKDERAQGLGSETKLAATEQGRLVRLTAGLVDDSNGLFKLTRLDGTSGLARGLAQVYGKDCDVYTGLDSTKENLLSKVAPNLDRYRFLVFATHGFAGNQVPGIMEPALAFTMVPLGTDGFLTMSEVAGLNIKADVAALTACQTGTGVRLAGEGVLSMGRAFLSAGARSVVMSLWSVAEKPSVLIMEDFFKRMKQGQGSRKAWNDAVKDVRARGFDHPFFWGAFILVGEAG